MNNWTNITADSDGEATGGFVPGAVVDGIGHLVEPLWEVCAGRLPF